MLSLYISTMFVTHHGLDKFAERKFKLPAQVDGYIIHQLRKGDEIFKSPRFKLAFPILEDRYAICDVFESRHNGDLVVKMLTTLSKKELSESRNLDCGKVLKTVSIKFPGASVKEDFLNADKYVCGVLKDFLKM